MTTHTLPRKTNKLLSKIAFAGSGSAPATTVDNWIPPLQRHARADGGNEFTTIRIRLFGSDVQQDFNAKFPSGPLYPRDVCKVVSDKQGLSEEARKIFSLWIVGRDIELQLRPNEDIFKLMVRWHKWVEKYTHYPEAKNPTHPINRHWFVFRRSALISREEEKRIADVDEVAVRLLYGESQHNVQSGKYPCTIDDAVNLAGLELQSHGDYDSLRHQPGYLSQNDRWTFLVPLLLQKSLKPQQWEQRITEAFKAQKGKNTFVARIRYLQYVRKWPFYGACFFPCCLEAPPGNFFEMRFQHYLMGISLEGITVVDQDKHASGPEKGWAKLLWEFAQDSIQMWYFKNGKQKKMEIITPQAVVVENVITRALHLLSKQTETPAPEMSPDDQHLLTTPPLLKHASSGLSHTGSIIRSSQVSGSRPSHTGRMSQFIQKASDASVSAGARRLSVARGIRERNAMSYIASPEFQRMGAVGIINDEPIS